MEPGCSFITPMRMSCRIEIVDCRAIMKAVSLAIRTEKEENLKSVYYPEYYGLYFGQPGEGITINRRWVVVF